MAGRLLVGCIVGVLTGFAAFGQQAPTADFSATPTTGNRPLLVQFADLSDPGSDPITEWAWDFNNDTVIDSIEQNPSYTYNTAGTYTVTLTVTSAA